MSIRKHFPLVDRNERALQFAKNLNLRIESNLHAVRGGAYRDYFGHWLVACTDNNRVPILNLSDKMAKLIFNERDVGRVSHSVEDSHVVGQVEKN